MWCRRTCPECGHARAARQCGRQASRGSGFRTSRPGPDRPVSGFADRANARYARAMQAIGGPSIFDGLRAGERDQMLGRLERRKFAPGAVMIAAGERSHRLFLMEHGLAEVFVADRHGVEHLVGGADMGTVLGEMALLR